jgi:pyruvate kinase
MPEENPRPYRSTKIIFTLGPATEGEAVLERMIRGGADVVRLNMAHGNHDWSP